MSSNNHLYRHLIEKIKKSGELKFSEFMEDALYHNIYGYYNKEEKIFGTGGDFITSPIISPLFGECLGQEFLNISHFLDKPSILEIGGGDASLTIAMLKNLQKEKHLPIKYIIIESSSYLTQIQKNNIKKEIPDLFNIIQWEKNIDTISMNGLIIANEFFDALPSERFKYDGKGFLISYIAESNGSLVDTWGAISPNLMQELEIAVGLPDKIFPKNYTSELNMQYRKWIESIDDAIDKGVIMIIDYGYNSHEYFLDDRKEGTLVCAQKHLANFNYLDNVGKQDISTFVNFSHLARISKLRNLDVCGYLTQLNLLLNLGILEMFQKNKFHGNKKEIELNKLKNILLPNTMGELFKTLVLKKNFDRNLLCTKKYNHVGRL